MKRRAFLGSAAQAGASMALLAASWPHFLREAFAGEGAADAKAAQEAEQRKRDRLALLSEAYRRAQQAGKPLLALVIPAAREDKWKRGRHFGAWLNYGTVEQRWPLALCEVVCADMDDLRQLVPTVGLGEPLMLLIETDRVPATVHRLDAKLPERSEEPSPVRGLSVRQLREQFEEEAIDTRTALLAKLVSTAVAGSPALLEKRVAQLRAALPPATVPVHADLHAAKLSAAQATSLAPLVAQTAARAQPGERTALYGLLAGAADTRLREQRIPGSYWARASGCGTEVEGVESSSIIGCGMGHVPQKSRRFLYFFTIGDPGAPL